MGVRRHRRAGCHRRAVCTSHAGPTGARPPARRAPSPTSGPGDCCGRPARRVEHRRLRRCPTIARSGVPTTTLAERPDARAAPAAPRRPRRSDLLTPAAIALTVTPLVVLAVHMLRSDFVLDRRPGDDRDADTRRRRPLALDRPVLRATGGSTPGPALFYALARRTGCSAATGRCPRRRGRAHQRRVRRRHGPVLARRRGGTGLMLATLVGLGLAHARPGADVPGHPVEPLRHCAPVRRAAVSGLGRRGGRAAGRCPGATVVTSFLMQTHVGYVALALPLLAGRRSLDRRGHTRRPPPGPRRRSAGDEVGGGEDGGDEDPGGEPVSEADRARRTRPPAGGAAGACGRRGRRRRRDVAAPDRRAGDARRWEHRPHRRVVPRPGEEARTLLEGWRVVADQYTVGPSGSSARGPDRHGRACRGLRRGGPGPPRAGARRRRGACGGAGVGRPGRSRPSAWRPR